MVKKIVNENVIITNKKAHFNYFIEDEFSAGLSLQGWEVKSLRAKRGQISNSYIIIKDREAYLLGSIITPLPTVSTHFEPDSDRSRKLLLTKSELRKLYGKVKISKYTLIPLNLYWKKNFIKCKFGLGKGKKRYDKREDIKNREWRRNKVIFRAEHNMN